MKEALYGILYGLCGFLFIAIALLGAIATDSPFGE